MVVVEASDVLVGDVVAGASVVVVVAWAEVAGGSALLQAGARRAAATRMYVDRFNGPSPGSLLGRWGSEIELHGLADHPGHLT